jgi:hypothetical protein
MGRVKKDCPLCGAQGFKRLANHMRQVHGNSVHDNPVHDNPVHGNPVHGNTGPHLPSTQESSHEEDVKSQAQPWWENKSLLPFEPYASMWISGCTGAGKSWFVYKFLQNLQGLYTDDPPTKVLYCYGVYQNLFDQMEQTLPNFTLHPGVPTWAEIEEFADGKHHLIVLDDLLQHVIQNQEIQDLVTMGNHHKKLSTFILGQNLFPQGKCARTISLNCSYLVLFQNLRDMAQISCLAR